MRFTVNDIGTFIQLNKGMKITARHIFSPLCHLVAWEMNSAYGAGSLMFDSPALLLAINEEKRTIVVRLPFVEPNTEFIVDMDEKRSLFEAI